MKNRDILIQVTGKACSGKSIIMAIIAKALLDAGVPGIEVCDSARTGVYEGREGLANRLQNMDEITESSLPGEFRIMLEEIQAPRKFSLVVTPNLLAPKPKG